MILLISSLWLTVINSFSQAYPVIVTVTVTPPYTTKVNDYISQPNKIMATLLNTSGSSIEANIQGVITGEGGIRIYTDPDFRMSHPLTLYPGIPYYLNPVELQEIYDANYLEYEGISENDLIYGNGLPEGFWQICLTAFNYDTGERISGEEPQGCSNTFFIADIEPPVVQFPLPGQEVTAGSPQYLVFSWTWPPGAPANTGFTLKIIEVLPGVRDINDAFNSAAYPVFFEKNLNGTSYLYGPADPMLVTGKTYAFTITAFDPNGQLSFRNNGMSEVSSFYYMAGDSIK